MIQFSLTGDIEIQARLDSVYPSFIASVMHAFNETDAALASYIKDVQLGGAVLQRRTGRLAESVRPIPSVSAAGVVTGGVEQDSAQAPYGRFHEYGAQVPTRFGNPVMRWIGRGGEVVFSRTARGFTLPVRSFMRSALEEYMPVYEAAVTAAIREGLGG